MGRPTFIVLLLFSCWLWLAAVAQADVGGNIPAPGLCDYPGTGGSAMVMSTYIYWCDFPMEENGSHWHCELGGASVIGTVGVSIFMINANIAANVGSIDGSCSWRCPDNTLAAGAPNPPGAWKNYLKPRHCVSAPLPPPPPNDQAVGSGPPYSLPGGENPALGETEPITPAVTNPVNPNPDATQNPPASRP